MIYPVAKGGRAAGLIITVKEFFTRPLHDEYQKALHQYFPSFILGVYVCMCHCVPPPFPQKALAGSKIPSPAAFSAYRLNQIQGSTGLSAHKFILVLNHLYF